MNAIARITATLMAAGTLAGCAATSPDWDATFGDAARQLRAQQLIDPDAPLRNQGSAVKVDGRATREAGERYVDSYKAPPPSSVVNIGVGGAAPGAGR